VTFAAIAVLGLLTLGAIARLVPPLPPAPGADLRRGLRALRDVPVLLAMLTTLLGFGGVLAAITYLAPPMTEVAGFAPSATTWLLVVLGIGMVAGNWAGGKLADRALVPTVLTSLGVLVVALLAFVGTSRSQPLAVLTILVIGAVGFAAVAPLQTLVMDRAVGAPTLASALSIGAFNLGNAVAAWLGGAAIDAVLGYSSVGWVGALLTGGGLAVALVSVRLTRPRVARPSRSRISGDTPGGVPRPRREPSTSALGYPPVPGVLSRASSGAVLGWPAPRRSPGDRRPRRTDAHLPVPAARPVRGACGVTAQPEDRLGPVDYLVVRLPDDGARAGFDALLAVVDAGRVRILDLEVLVRSEDGVLLVETAAWGSRAGIDLGAFAGATSGLLDDEDRAVLAEQLDAGQSALVVVYEVLVLDPVLAAFTAAGGTVLDEGPVGDDALLDALDLIGEDQA
jgi:hypothetical protein